MTAFDLDAFLPYRLSLLANRTRHGFAAHYEREHGIDNAEWRVLAHLSQSPRISVRDIQQQTELEKSKVSRAVSRLEQRGLLKKEADPSDSRLLSLHLTPAGQRLMDSLSDAAQRYQTEALDTLSERERAAVDRGLRLLMRALAP